MKSMKRSIAMLLTLALVFASFPLGAFAEQELVAEQSSEAGGVSPAESQTEVKQEAKEETPLEIGPEEEKEAVRGGGQKARLLFDYDYLDKLGDGRTHPEVQGDERQDIEQMFKNIEITVTPENSEDGEPFTSPKEFVGSDGKPATHNENRRFGGEWPVGTVLIVKIGTENIIENYHVSHCDENVKQGIVTAGSTTYKVKIEKDLTVRVPFGLMKVVFNTQGGYFDDGSGTKNYGPIEEWVQKDNTVHFPANPVKPGLTFDRWYTKSSYKNDAGNPIRHFWTSAKEYSYRENDWRAYNEENFDPKYDGYFVLRALWKATVTFDTDGGSAIDSQTVEEGKTATEPATNPTKKNCEFLGWYTAKGTEGVEFDFSQAIKQHTTVYAHWKQEKATVTFDYNDGTTPKATEEVKIGEKVKKPQDPTRDGYTFKGWELDGKPFNFETAITEDITLKAKWEENKATVTFDYNDEKTPNAKKEVKIGEKVMKPEDPTRDGYTFKGWELDGEPFNFETPIKADITLKAKWEKKQTPTPKPDDPSKPSDPTKPSTPDKPSTDQPSPNVPSKPGDKRPGTDSGMKTPNGSPLTSSEIAKILASMKKTVPYIPRAGVGK